MGVEILVDGGDKGGARLNEGVGFLEEGVEVGVDRLEDEGHDGSERGAGHFEARDANHADLQVWVEARY
jgi:hypothetical protein